MKIERQDVVGGKYVKKKKIKPEEKDVMDILRKYITSAKIKVEEKDTIDSTT